jgi:hypothetical protein
MAVAPRNASFLANQNQISIEELVEHSLAFATAATQTDWHCSLDGNHASHADSSLSNYLI